MSENPFVGPRASGSVTGKDGEAGDIDTAGRSPVAEQAARSQIGFSDRLLEAVFEATMSGDRSLGWKLGCGGQIGRFLLADA